MSGTKDGCVRYTFGDLQSRSGSTSNAFSFGSIPQASGRKEMHGALPVLYNYTAGKLTDLVNRSNRPLTKREQKDRGEEERLLGGTSYQDPKGVPIIPGSSRQKSKVGANLAFKPQNTLNRDQARATLNRSSVQVHISPRSAINKTRFTSHDDTVEHARKKLKLDTPLSVGNVIELDDDENPPVQFISSQTKSTSPRPHKLRSPSVSSVHAPGSQGATSKTSEFWNVENVIKPPTGATKKKSTRSARMGENTEEDDSFTRGAKEERIRSQHGALEGTRKSKRGGKPREQYMAAVEIQVPKSDKRTDEEETPALRNSFVTIDGRLRNNAQRESPDELQGERTMEDRWRQAEAQKRTSRISPNDIRPTDFSPASGKRAINGGQRADSRKKQPSEEVLAIRQIRFEDKVLDGQRELVLDENNGYFYVRSYNQDFQIVKINSFYHSDDPGNTKITLIYPMSQASHNNHVDIEFANEKDYCSFFASVSQLARAKQHSKSKEWMDKSFQRRSHHKDRSTTPAQKRLNVNDAPVDGPTPPQSPKPKRQKLSETLQNGNDAVEQTRPERRKGRDRPELSGITKWDGSSDRLSHAHPSPDTKSSWVEIPVKTYKDPARLTRQTRSQAKPQNYVLDSDDDEPGVPFSPVKIRGKWTKPLVYPKTGKKKAEVEALDLERLRDQEFLNDNLIGLYIRFLEHHLERTNPDLAKRIYFFNSYFFASLTNKPRGTRGINYQAVEKWTRSVDLFSYDYVVVPINESAHWYIAIICNLPNLIRSVSENEGELLEDIQEDDETPKRTQDDVQITSLPLSTAVSKVHEATRNDPAEASLENGKDDWLRESFSSMTLQDPAPVSPPSRSRPETPAASEQLFAEKDDWPDEEENQKHYSPAIPKNLKHVAAPNEVSTGVAPQGEHATAKSENHKPGKKKGKKQRPPIKKVDPRQPVILTIDSLGFGRPRTIRILKDYLEEEGKSKRSLTFNSSKFISGMTAKEIPQQPNSSDCGLYLLAYLEKFIRDPDIFVAKLLQKEMNEKVDWPTMTSGAFRRRLHQFLLNLYEEQYGEKSNEIGSAQMVDRKPLHILLVDDEPAVDNHKSASPELGQPSSSEQKPRAETPKKVEKKISETVLPVKQQATPARSSPRFKRTDNSKKQFTESPAARNDKSGSHSFFDDLEGMIDVEQQRLSPDLELCVPETPPRQKTQSDKSDVTSPLILFGMDPGRPEKLRGSPEVEEISD